MRYGRATDLELATENAAELAADDWPVNPIPLCGLSHIPEAGNVRSCRLPCEPRHTRHESLFRGELIHWDDAAEYLNNRLAYPGEFKIMEGL